MTTRYHIRNLRKQLIHICKYNVGMDYQFSWLVDNAIESLVDIIATDNRPDLIDVSLSMIDQCLRHIEDAEDRQAERSLLEEVKVTLSDIHKEECTFMLHDCDMSDITEEDEDDVSTVPPKTPEKPDRKLFEAPGAPRKAVRPQTPFKSSNASL